MRSSENSPGVYIYSLWGVRMVNIYLYIEFEPAGDSSNCSYTDAGKTNYGIIQVLFFSSHNNYKALQGKTTGSSLLRTAGDLCRDCLREYAKHDMLSAFFVEVSGFLPVIAVPISNILCKCVLVLLYLLTNHTIICY